MRSGLRNSLLCLLMASAGPALAQEIYRYVEKDGTVVYTNVPPPGSQKAKKVKGSFRPAPRPSSAVPRARKKSDYDDLIAQAAKKYRVPEALVRAIMHAESNFNATAVSHKGASGLMQLMPKTAEAMYVKDIFEPEDNIDGGVRYLRHLANQYDGDMVKMIAAYNAGPAAVDRYKGNIPPFPETQAYVRKVLALYYQYKKDGDAGAGN